MSARQTPAQPLRLHRMILSGHAHRAQLFLSLLGLSHELIDVDLRAGAHKQPEFLRLNAFGQVPVLEDGDLVIADSNAILVYLAERYAPISWYPTEPATRAAIQRWLSVAAGPLAYGPAAARRTLLFNLPGDTTESIKAAHALIGVMDRELEARPFLIGAHATLADLAMYTYVALAPEGNVALDDYRHVQAWLKRVEALPGFIPMPQSKVGLRASA